MKKVLFFLTLTLFMFSCEKDENITADLINDRGLNTAPYVTPGEYIFATRFTASEMGNHQGKTLQGVEYYLQNKPNQCEIRIYSGSNGDEPANLVYSESVTADMDAESWNLHAPTSAVEITGEDMWLAVRVVLNNEDQTVGCDVGPAVSNGDFFLSSEDNIWTTYRNYTNPAVSVNWNIRGYVSE